METNLLQGRPTNLTVATRLFMTIMCAKQSFNPTTNNKVTARTRMQDGRTYGQLYATQRFFREHNKLV